MVYCRECAFSTEQRAPLFYSPALLHLHWIRELLPFTTSTQKTSLTALNSLHFFLLFKPTHKKKKKKEEKKNEEYCQSVPGGQGRNLTILDIRNSFRISLVRKLTLHSASHNFFPFSFPSPCAEGTAGGRGWGECRSSAASVPPGAPGRERGADPGADP